MKMVLELAGDTSPYEVDGTEEVLYPVSTRLKIFLLHVRVGAIFGGTGEVYQFPALHVPEFSDDLYNRIELESLTLRGYETAFASTSV